MVTRRLLLVLRFSFSSPPRFQLQWPASASAGFGVREESKVDDDELDDAILADRASPVQKAMALAMAT